MRVYAADDVNPNSEELGLRPPHLRQEAVARESVGAAGPGPGAGVLLSAPRARSVVLVELGRDVLDKAFGGETCRAAEVPGALARRHGLEGLALAAVSVPLLYP